MSERIVEILRDAKILAREYYQLTGKPLGITGEIAEFEAYRLLGLQLCTARQCGYDALNKNGDRIQIKGRCFSTTNYSGQRVGTINLEKEWDKILLVLMDDAFETREIYQSDRIQVEKEISRPGSKARERGALPVLFFKNHGQLVWKRTTTNTAP